MSLNAKHISFPSSSLWYSPKKSAETRTDLIKGNFIDIASANLQSEITLHFLPFPYQEWGICYNRSTEGRALSKKHYISDFKSHS